MTVNSSQVKSGDIVMLSLTSPPGRVFNAPTSNMCAVHEMGNFTN